jgi:glycosyltransferase involved in cell wall biosynthesis
MHLPGLIISRFARTGYQHLQQYPQVKNADVINLHWISYLVDYPTFFKKLNKPVIFTLHDTNLFTGGCHYTFGCERYQHDCTNCPQLAEGVRRFAAKHNLKLKQDSLQNLRPDQVVVVSPSKWLMGLSQQSTLFENYQHFYIPYGIDTDTFKKRDRTESRIKLGLPADKFIVLFVGTSLAEHRKGFDVILKLRAEFKNHGDVQFVAIGKTGETYDGILNLGYMENKNLIAMAYSAANVFVIPSRQDNLPNTMLEALCCGTPVIGYKTGGIVDAVQHGENGYLVEKESTADITAHILNMISNAGIFNNDAIAGTAKQKYSLEKQARAYQEIINKVFLVN